MFVLSPSLPFHSCVVFRHRSFVVRSSSSVQEVEKAPQDRDLSSELYSSSPFPSIKAAKRVVLVRHGQSTWNAEGRIQGSSNFSVLTPKGEAQADTSRQMLIDDSFDVCFSRFLLLVVLLVLDLPFCVVFISYNHFYLFVILAP